MVKVGDKSHKKYTQKGFKSPVHKNWEPPQSQSQPTTATKLPLQSISHINRPTQASMTCRPLQQSNYCHNYQHRPTNSKIDEIPGMLTPSLSKNNRSTLEEEFNASFFTQKHSVNNSEQGSVSSSKNSFNDSFQLYGTNVSVDEDGSREILDQVNSSVELAKDHHQFVKEFPKEEELRNHMKKSTHFFYNNGESILKDLDAQSNHSVTNSISSIKFS